MKIIVKTSLLDMISASLSPCIIELCRLIEALFLQIHSSDPCILYVKVTDEV